MLRRLIPMVLLGLSACLRPAPPPPTKVVAVPPRVMNVPPGCLENFGGDWKHADDSTWRYLARDDGGTLELDAFRIFDGGSADKLFPSAHILLERRPDGFSGEAVADVLHPSGRICSARYPTSVTNCGDGGLVLLAAAAVSLGDGCQTPLPPRTPVMLEHRLVRADPGQLRPETKP